jgi:hypothetical protein
VRQFVVIWGRQGSILELYAQQADGSLRIASYTNPQQARRAILEENTNAARAAKSLKGNTARGESLWSTIRAAL